MASYLYVKGYNSETTLVDLIIYFQSKESRGGDIDDEECKFEKDEAILAFDEEEGTVYDDGLWFVMSTWVNFQSRFKIIRWF